MRCPKIYYVPKEVTIDDRSINLINLGSTVHNTPICSLTYKPCNFRGRYPKDCPIYRESVLGLKEQKS